MENYREWLSRELGEEVTAKRAIYMTLWVISFLVTLLGGCAENILIACVGVAGVYVFGVKSEMMIWQKRKK
jgi:hypothetical protein